MRRQVRRMWLATLAGALTLAPFARARAARQATDDPVLAARAARAAAGRGDADLPPVPRTIIEPPPLPPPELHPRDMKGSRASRAAKRASRKSGKAKGGKSAKAGRSGKTGSPKGRKKAR